MDVVKDEAHYKALAESASLGLPLPRLQLTWCGSYCYYDLLFPCSEFDIRQIEDTRMAKAELGKTKCERLDGVPGCETYGTDTPYRDGVHAGQDSKVLSFPAFVVNGKNFKHL